MVSPDLDAPLWRVLRVSRVPICDYCGEVYRGGKVDHGSWHFCTHQCRDRGKILSVLERFSKAAIGEHIRKVRLGPCPECGADAPIDAHKSHIAVSYLIATSWKSNLHICCRRCAQRYQWKAIGTTIAWGWWGVPWGFIMTPVQIIRNLIGMRQRSDDLPSLDFIRIVRLNLAAALAASAQRPQ
jgi:hypothetical protein